MPPTRAQLLATTSKFFEAFSSWDFATIISMRTATCSGISLPPSKRMFTSPANMKEAWEDSTKVFKSMKLCIIDESDTVVDEAARKVAVRIRGNSETVAGPFENEWIFILTMNEDGTLVDKIQHFCDTAVLSQLEKRVESATGQEIKYGQA
ncbi:hypothetical protein BDW59DRAFT_145308 [Aspergillus cavernicola]|uniref:SnoaL-like domain-containing protein n=1 Tax=Aspergillus cavernicola TaxID=176166 RepID=A0ABR4IEN0_9EURO